MALASASSSSLSSSTSATTRPAPHQPKLRDTCNACAKAKVRCSKDRPTCARCARLEWACEYAPSNRLGRAAKKAPRHDSGYAPNTPKRPCMQSNSPVPMDTQDSCSTSTSSFEIPAVGNSPLPPTTFDNVNFDFNDINQTFASWLSWELPVSSGGQADLNFPTTMMSDIDMLGYGGDNQLTDMELSNLLDLSTPPPQTTTTATQTDCHPKTPLHHESPKTTAAYHDTNSCLSTVLAIFDSLLPRPTHCNSRSTQTPPSLNLPTLKSVISENREIINKVDCILDCPCSHNAYLLSVLNLVLLQILTWYAAAARGSIANNGTERKAMPPGVEAPPSWDGTPQSFDEEVVVHEPATVGQYNVVNGDGGRSASQLVLSELHRVQRLIERVVRRKDEVGKINNSKDGDSHSPTNTPAGSVPSLNDLGGELKKRLKSVTSDIVETLKQ